MEDRKMEDRKMTCAEWNDATEWLENGAEGYWVEHNDKTVEVVSMCGGRYLCCDKYGYVQLVDEVWRALDFLNRYVVEEPRVW